MTPPLARRLLLAAVVLGVAGNWLLRAEWWRAGFLIWVLGIIAVAVAASRHVARAKESSDPSAPRERHLLFASAAVLATLLILRDAAMLFVLDLFALGVVAALIAWRAGGRSLSLLEPRDALVGGIAAAATVITGAPTLAMRDAAMGPIETSHRRALGGYGIGALAASPVLLIVALLLASADPLFAGMLESAGAMLDVSLVGHVLGSAIAAWVVAGGLRGSLIPVGIGVAATRVRLRLSFPIVAPLLGGLALLLGVWIALQVRTLFGGADYVATTGGVTVSEYARQGFFELIVIAGIVLAALLVSDEVLDRTPGRERRSFRTVGFVLLGFVGTVLASALYRLGLYLNYFGLTEDRMLALAVLVWVGTVLSWFGFTVLRDRRSRFAPGVLVLSAVWLGALNLANPERWIVETNLRRAERGLAFDGAYHAKLSADALPALLRGLDRLAPTDAADVRAEITREWARRAVEREDWRSWSLPYVFAAKQVRSGELPPGT
jgi:hypothetical protein